MTSSLLAYQIIGFVVVRVLGQRFVRNAFKILSDLPTGTRTFIVVAVLLYFVLPLTHNIMDVC